MRSKLLFLLISGAFLLVAGKSCNPGNKYEDTLLWKISGNGLDKPSYVFGTIHVMDNRAYSFNDSVLKKLEACSAVALEIDLGGNFSEEIGRSMMYGGDTTLKDFYTEEEYYTVISSVKEQVGLDESRIKKLRPYVVLMFLSQSPLEMDRPRAVDQYLHAYAKKRDKRIKGIERIEEQIAALKTIGPDDLLKYIRSIDKHKHQMEQLVKAYEKEDLNKIHAMVKNAPSVLNKQVFFTERNASMTRRIDSMVQEEPTFVAIGSGHLPGKKGVLSLLKKKGYKVEPVMAPKADTIPELKVTGDWVKLNPDPGTFSVMMPGEPEQNVVTKDVSAGELKVHNYMYRGSSSGRNFAYGVTVSDYSVLGLNTAGVSDGQLDMIYSRAKTSFVSKMQGKVVKDSTFYMNDSRGKIYHILIRNGKALIRLRTILSGSYMYIVQVICPADQKNNEEADKFFNSFKIKQ